MAERHPFPDGWYLRLCRLVIRAGRDRIGDGYADELLSTLRQRLGDSHRLPVPQRVALRLRELIALIDFAWRGSSFAISAGRRRPWWAQMPRRVAVSLGDLRGGVRQLRQAPAFTLVSVSVLAVGIGVNSAVFSIVNSVILRPLPYAAPERLLRISLQNPRNRFNVSVADFLSLRQAQGFEQVAAFTTSGSSWYRQTFQMTLTGGIEPEAVDGTWVTVGYFEALGVAPLLGRTLQPGEDEPDAEPTLLVSHGFWQRRLGATDDVVGRSLEINGTAHRVLGVMPPDFRPLGNARAEIWPAFRMLEPGRRGPFFLTVVGRMAPGWTQEQVAAALEPLDRQVGERWADSFDATDTHYVTTSWSREVVGDVGPTLWALMIAVLLVLFIALSNVASLLLSRAARRRHEFALRVALGAGPGRLLGQLLAEGAVLAGLGGVAGIGLGRALLEVLARNAPAGLPRQSEIVLNGSVLAFTVAVMVLAALVFGLVPARHGLGADAARSIREGSRTATAARQQMRTRAVLVVVELALAVPLLTGALLMVESVLKLQRVDPGFDATSGVTLRLAPPVEALGSTEGLLSLYGEIRDAMAATPGVERAALSTSLPPSELRGRNNFVRRPSEGEADPGQEVAHFVSVSPGFFDTLGVPLISGRAFDDADGAQGRPVTMVDTTFADRYLRSREALGEQMQFGGSGPWFTVVGLVGGVRYEGLQRPEVPTIYVPLAQQPQSQVFLTVRGPGAAAEILKAVRSKLATLMPNTAPTRIRTLPALVEDSVAAPRRLTLLLGFFAFVAVGLAALGVYGVMAAFVSQQGREFGVRMAVGAGGGAIVRLVLRRALVLVLPGLAIGLGLAILGGRVLGAVMELVSPPSLANLGAAGAVLGLVALAGTLVPAWRARRVDPLTALREV